MIYITLYRVAPASVKKIANNFRLTIYTTGEDGYQDNVDCFVRDQIRNS